MHLLVEIKTSAQQLWGANSSLSTQLLEQDSHLAAVQGAMDGVCQIRRTQQRLAVRCRPTGGGGHAAARERVADPGGQVAARVGVHLVQAHLLRASGHGTCGLIACSILPCSHSTSTFDWCARQQSAFGPVKVK